MILSQGDSLLAGYPFSKEYGKAGAIVSRAGSLFFRLVSAVGWRWSGAGVGIWGCGFMEDCVAVWTRRTVGWTKEAKGIKFAPYLVQNVSRFDCTVYRKRPEKRLFLLKNTRAFLANSWA
jgi:hypothetical protein